MKVAVVGPITKDTVNIDGVSKTYMGGIPYYEAHVFKIFGVDVEAYITYAKRDEEWVLKNFKGIKIHPIYIENTLESNIFYSKKEPDIRKVLVKKYDPSVIPPNEKLINELGGFDYILLGPLYHENISYGFFEKLKGRNLILGNFGMFTYNEDDKMVWKNPENLVRVSKFLQYLFLDENEVKFVVGKDKIEDCAEFFLGLGVKTVVITRGSKGSLIFQKNSKYLIPAFPVNTLIDPTGAGDTYVAAFIVSTGLLNDLQKQGEFAAMAATMAIEKHGAFDRSLEEVLKRLKEFKNR